MRARSSAVRPIRQFRQTSGEIAFPTYRDHDTGHGTPSIATPRLENMGKYCFMVEQLHPGVSAKDARVCLFDFDGTISLIRSGWMDVMVPMMVETLAELHTGETVEQLRETVEDYV